ncbi:hypothetical protein B566_EDAN012746 [Ephemera danica]|nr:hypothetical protein B566_EDAN012746 [Ephemera danica]
MEQFLQLGFLVDSGIKFANNNPEVRTSAGRGRAFLRYCLAHACLGDALQQSLLETDALAAWYQPIAPLRDPNLAQQLVALAYELAEVNFDLAAGGHDLDSGWPTFAR